MDNSLNEAIDALRELLGDGAVIAGSGVRERSAGFIRPGEGLGAAALVRPASTQQVSRVLAICHARGVPVVPVGGLTGMSDGGLCGPHEIALSLERMAAVESIDTGSATLTVQAGATLEAVQEYAAAHGFLFAVDIGARGSAQIGGAVSTNAGGLKTVRYGPMRDQVLGLEAVLADGRVVGSLHGVIKNNTGIDLKHLFIGSEGMLGIVTRVVLRLRPVLLVARTAVVACPDFASVLALLAGAQAGLGGALSSFEVMWNDFYAFVTREGHHQAPVDRRTPFAVLIEAEYAGQGDDLRFEQFLEDRLADDTLRDAAVAQSLEQRRGLWRIREGTELLEVFQPQYRYDVSVPVQHMGAYVEQVWAALQCANPGGRCFTFGHAGDSNVHFVVVPVAVQDFSHEDCDALVYAPLQALGGAVSAEHGIGLAKRDALHFSRTPVEIEVMRAVKQALDPHGILNRGKVLPPASHAA